MGSRTAGHNTFNSSTNTMMAPVLRDSKLHNKMVGSASSSAFVLHHRLVRFWMLMGTNKSWQNGWQRRQRPRWQIVCLYAIKWNWITRMRMCVCVYCAKSDEKTTHPKPFSFFLASIHPNQMKCHLIMKNRLLKGVPMRINRVKLVLLPVALKTTILTVYLGDDEREKWEMRDRRRTHFWRRHKEEKASWKSMRTLHWRCPSPILRAFFVAQQTHRLQWRLIWSWEQI